MALTKISTAMWNSVPHHDTHDFNVDDVLYVDVSADRVGIGTTSPAANLHLKSTGGITLLLEADSDNVTETDNPVIQFSQDGGGVTANIGLEGEAGTTFPTSGSNGFYIDSTEEIMLGTAGTERMRITNGGDLTIGGTSTTTAGSLNKGVYLQSQTDGDVLGYSLYSNEGTNNRRVNFFLDDTNGVYGFQTSYSSGAIDFVVNSAGSERMRIDSSGHIDINGGNIILRNGSLYAPTSDAVKDAFIANDDGNLEFAINGPTNGTYGTMSFIRRKGDSSDPSTIMTIDSSGLISMKTLQPSSGEEASLSIENTDVSVIANQALGYISFVSNDSSTNSSGGVGGIAVKATSDYSTGTTPSYMAFYVHNNSGNDGTKIGNPFEVARFLHTGGMTFNGDTAAANALDDYEEGTFTPEVADASTGGNTATYSSRQGHYTKIGRQVTVTCQFADINTTGMTGSNFLYITDLPFTPASLTGTAIYTGALKCNFLNAATGSLGFIIYCLDGSPYFNIAEQADNGSGAALTISDINSGSCDLQFSLTYFAS